MIDCTLSHGEVNLNSRHWIYSFWYWAIVLHIVLFCHYTKLKVMRQRMLRPRSKFAFGFHNKTDIHNLENTLLLWTHSFWGGSSLLGHLAQSVCVKIHFSVVYYTTFDLATFMLNLLMTQTGQIQTPSKDLLI